MLEGLGAYIETLPEDGRAAMDPMRAEWARQREVHRRELITMLDSRDYRDFVEDYLDFTETSGAGELPVTPGTPQLVRHTVAGRVWTAYERVRAHSTTLAWADVTALHALRIDCKRLRYTLESFREVLPPKAEVLIAEVVRLQDHLGLLNDADVAAARARAWLTANASRVPPESLSAVRLYLDTREAEVNRLKRRFQPLWRRVEGPGYRRTLALAIATP
jgi:CHAD domain-containing protein